MCVCVCVCVWVYMVSSFDIPCCHGEPTWPVSQWRIKSKRRERDGQSDHDHHPAVRSSLCNTHQVAGNVPCGRKTIHTLGLLNEYIHMHLFEHKTIYAFMFTPLEVGNIKLALWCQKWWKWGYSFRVNPSSHPREQSLTSKPNNQTFLQIKCFPKTLCF